MARVSLFQYEKPTKPSPRTSPRVAPPRPNRLPKMTKRPAMAASSTAVFMEFLLISQKRYRRVFGSSGLVVARVDVDAGDALVVEHVDVAAVVVEGDAQVEAGSAEV